jgi:hypothetical protein
MRHSPLGFPSSTVLLDCAVVTRVSGSGWWKYHHSVAQSIIAICRVGELLSLKSLLFGFEMDDM